MSLRREHTRPGALTSKIGVLAIREIGNRIIRLGLRWPIRFISPSILDDRCQ